MKVLLVRHGETVDNVAGVYAGVTDSALTNHGMLQAKRLGKHTCTIFRFTHIFSSDLQRAYKTALAVQQAQREQCSDLVEVVQLKILQEQNFGSFERMTFAARAQVIEDATEVLEQPETKEAMAVRADQFVDDYLLPILYSEAVEEKALVAVVSHGLLLSTLWRCLLKRFPPSHVALGRGVELPTRDMQSLEQIGAWSNTGYLELSIETSDLDLERDQTTSRDEISTLLSGYKMSILGINNKDHLRGLKRTGGGVGSSKHDETQKSIESFFKRPKTR